MSEISLVPVADVILAFFEGIAWSSVPTLLLSSLLCKKILKSSINHFVLSFKQKKIFKCNCTHPDAFDEVVSATCLACLGCFIKNLSIVFSNKCKSTTFNSMCPTMLVCN